MRLAVAKRKGMEDEVLLEAAEDQGQGGAEGGGAAARKKGKKEGDGLWVRGPAAAAAYPAWPSDGIFHRAVCRACKQAHSLKRAKDANWTLPHSACVACLLSLVGPRAGPRRVHVQQGERPRGLLRRAG